VVRVLTPIVLACALLAGCGGTDAGGGGGTEQASLVLDFTPNAVHSGIFTALERDFDAAEGVDLRVRVPSSSTDAVALLEGGRADLAILDITDLAIARERGARIVGVMALVQRPLAAVLAQPSIRSPRDLEGRRAGVAGLPSDTAVLRSVVRGDGGDPAKVRTTTIGFNAVPALLGRRVAAATAFWNVEGVALRKKRPGIKAFRVDDYGAPAYPELVLCAAETTVQDDPDVVGGTVRALRRGYEAALENPERAAENLVERQRGLERETVLDELQAVTPALRSGVAQYGMLDADRLEQWSRWAVRFGIVRRPPDVQRTFDTSFAN
jgi:ABC-type nitrate/sulfonate/bicarbonate transport system substrate-binding protein